MAIFPIRTFGDPILRSKTTDVEKIDGALVQLINDMFETMYEAPGVGLAANQIGVGRSVAVFDTGFGRQVLINPELLILVPGEVHQTPTGEVTIPHDALDLWEYDEGCLSVPGYSWPITRPAWAVVTAQDAEGEQVVYAGDELLARVLQHEIDHLEGTLLIERLGKARKRKALKQIREDALEI
jgi:peptide deformylase